MEYIVIGILLLITGGLLGRLTAQDKIQIMERIPFEFVFDRLSTIHGVPKRLMVSIVKVESNFEPKAINQETNADKRLGRDVTSVGLGQILFPDTAKRINPNVTLTALYDPETNLQIAYKLMSGLLRAYPRKDNDGFPSYAVASYNAGSPKFNSSGMFVNQSYVDKVKAAWVKFANV